MNYPSIQDLVFLTYLTSNNLRLLHVFINRPGIDPSGPEFQKAAGVSSSSEMASKMQWARQQANHAIEYLNVKQIQIITCHHTSYPRDLLAIKNYPPVIYVMGALPMLRNIAIVGTRRPSPLAPAKVTTLAKIAHEAGLGIISGLALGIDTLAHKAALQCNAYTAAVLPVSLDKMYPPDNVYLAKDILNNGGCLLSELPPFFEPIVNPFVLRNRIQSALSDYIIPVEMGNTSGTSHTIKYAIQQGKKIILCKPSSIEIDHYFSHYEGILTTIAKYKTKRDQVTIINDSSTLEQLLKSKTQFPQRSLF